MFQSNHSINNITEIKDEYDYDNHIHFVSDPWGDAYDPDPTVFTQLHMMIEEIRADNKTLFTKLENDKSIPSSLKLIANDVKLSGLIYIKKLHSLRSLLHLASDYSNESVIDRMFDRKQQLKDLEDLFEKMEHSLSDNFLPFNDTYTASS